jgi:hypothetical protein
MRTFSSRWRQRDGHLPFLDTDIHRKPAGSLGHTVYCKPTHTNLYLNSSSHNYPSNKQAVLSTLVHRAKSLCDPESLHGELDFLRTTFRHNAYSDRQTRRALNPPEKVAPLPEKSSSVAFLPYVNKTFNRISRLLSKHNIKSAALPPKKIPSFLRSAKDDVGLKTPCVYSAPCECGHVYVGQTSRSIGTTIKEHHRHIRLEQPDKSALAEHSINLGHHIKL